MSKITFFFDFETRSRSDLPTVGAVKYCLDESTEVTLLTWCFGRTGTIKEWRKGWEVPLEILDVAYNPDKYLFVAHNIAFDFLVWTQVFSRIIPGLIRPSMQDLEDNMAITTHFRVGASLELAATTLRLPYNKDKEGRRLMLKQCKPGIKGEFYELTKDEWELFSRYGKIDTRLLRDVYYLCPALPAAERWAFEWTFKRNMRGIKLDTALLAELSSIVEENVPKLINEFDQCVSWSVKLNSPKLKEFFKPYYPWVENMQADTVRDMLADKTPVPKHVRRALEIKDLAGSTSIVKLKTAGEQKVNDRIYGILAYHYTQTKRWAGRGIQVHNFPRPDSNKVDSIEFDMNIEDLAGYVRSVRHTLKDPIGFVRNLLRRIFLPDAGMEFLCGDFSKVEPSVLFWLLDMGAIPKKWYEEMAAVIYNKSPSDIGKESEERQIGKAAALGCGYGMGADKFKFQVEKQVGISISEQLAQKAVQSYRMANPKITQLWNDLESAFRRAINGEATKICNGKILIMPMQHPHKGVQIRLPSGSHLYYHNAHIEMSQYKDKNGMPRDRQILCYEGGDDGAKTVYGGLLTEHVVSATARDILVPAMWRLEQNNFEVLNTVHDEIWVQSSPGKGEEFRSIMCVNPSWCDMKIDADFKNGVRYLK